MIRTRWTVVAAGLAATVALTGCGGGADESAAPLPAGQAAPEQVPDRGGGAPADDPAGTPGGTAEDPAGGQAGSALIDQRSIIFRGAMTVRVDNVRDAADQAGTLAARHGGFVGGDDRTSDRDGSRATLTLRIPSDRFYPAVTELASLGREETRDIVTEDVTVEVVDLQTRIDTARASVERTRQLLDRATSIADIVAIERELSTREAALASLQARQRELDDLTTLSTITVTLVGPDTPLRDPQPGFLAGLRAGWDGFLTTSGVLLTGLGWLLPWLIALGVPATAVVWWARRRGQRTAGPDQPAGA